MRYMYNLEKAETIKKVYESNRMDEVSNKDIEMAFECYYYYVDPKKYPSEFDENYTRLDNYFRGEIEDGIPHGTTVRELVLPLYYRIVKELFDREYFEERLEYHKNNDDKDCLYEFMHKLDIAQLKELLPVFMESFYIFSQHDRDALWNRLNEACLQENTNARVTNDIYDEYGYFNRKIKIYFFDYLDKKTVVNMICDSIQDADRKCAAILAMSMYEKDIDEVQCVISEWRCSC